MNDDPLPGMSDINRTIAYAAAAKLGELGFEWDGCAWSVTAPVAPIDMVLHCPACGLQHIDGPDERTPGWANAPHRSHMCHGCGHIWRPADVATNGVLAVKTKGKADSPPAAPAPVAQGGYCTRPACMTTGGCKGPCASAAPDPVAQGEYQQTRETLAACPPESTLHALSQQALSVLDKLDAPAPVATKDCEAVREAGRAADASVSFYNEMMGAAPAPVAQPLLRCGHPLYWDASLTQHQKQLQQR